ncbi:MAG TPA: hypothetical protein VHL31_01570 [Geminicoccus sp.]|nr:hypothetical protein [Geminicoccus sp.]HEX2524975.1 hypothetical protein [Geminicoccus sp.]
MRGAFRCVVQVQDPVQSGKLEELHDRSMGSADRQAATASNGLHAGNNSSKGAAVHEVDSSQVEHEILMATGDVVGHGGLESRRYAGIQALCQQAYDQDTFVMGGFDEVAV